MRCRLLLLALLVMASELSGSSGKSHRKDGQGKRKRRKLSLSVGKTCSQNVGAVPCNAGAECICHGRRLFGAPASSTVCTCQVAPSPPPPPGSPPPSSPPACG